MKIYAIIVWIALVPTPIVAADRTAADKQALSVLQDYVGGWKGVGLLQRGSSRGAWSEQADWAWKFADGRASLVFSAPEAKHYRSGRIMPADEVGHFELIAQRAEAAGDDRFEGVLKDGQLVVTAVEPREGQPARVTIRTVAGGDRLVMLLERKSDTGTYGQLAEIGYTRTGSDFAKGSSKPECVVTGGAGTIAVQFEGKTYYVCCSGCRDLFNEKPAEILAEYRARKAKE
jgi:hypothetical protein